ncbi:DNA adenine methylase [Priestia filamentosa]|uniref:DNA adenine methylase n=1 Tax=Priestia filamentosa TaxID=1402861 RepID=UPI003981F9F1
MTTATITNLFTNLNEVSTVQHTKEVHTPLRWFGGKFFLSKEIISRIPAHHCYVEPFAGSSQVLTQKTASKVEVINDIDESLINFLMTLRGQKEELIQSLMTLPTSRAIAERWMNEPLPEDPFEQAVRFYYLLRHIGTVMC